MWIKFGVIWQHGLQYYDDLVLKKDTKIYLTTHFEEKFDFRTGCWNNFKKHWLSVEHIQSNHFHKSKLIEPWIFNLHIYWELAVDIMLIENIHMYTRILPWIFLPIHYFRTNFRFQLWNSKESSILNFF
jgi:hypothetical protein